MGKGESKSFACVVGLETGWKGLEGDANLFQTDIRGKNGVFELAMHTQGDVEGHDGAFSES